MLDYFIRQSVAQRTAVVIFTLMFGLYGLYAYFKTPIEAYPDVTPVQVNVIAQMSGLAPDEIERQLTVPLERALNGTPQMVEIRSESLFGLSLIWLTFEDDADSFRARQLVGERVAGANLPEGAETELAPDYTPAGKVFYYQVTSDRHNLHELRAYQELTITRVLQQIPGVAEVSGLGGFITEYHVEVDPIQLEATGLNLTDVSEALEHSNINVGGGFIQRGEQEMIIRGIGLMQSAQDIRDVVLNADEGLPITVGDVARVVQSHSPRRGTVGRDNHDEIVQGIVLLQRGENPSVVLDKVREKIQLLNNELLPEGLTIEPIYDRQNLIDHTLNTVHNNLFNGALLVIGIVWLFLRSIRGSLIVATVIPLSLLTAFAGLHWLGLPANLISMGAIDFGIIVDGAVVLIESVIARARQQQLDTARDKVALVVRSAIDIARPTFYAMAIIIAALLPVFTLQDVEGRIFQPLALTYAFALTGALIFSLTVVPSLCVLFLKIDRIKTEEPRFVESIKAGYARLLSGLLKQRLWVFISAGILLIAGMVATTKLGTEFLPELNEGDIYVFAEMPPSTSLEEAQRLLRELRLLLLQAPEVRTVVSEQGRPEDGTDNEGVNMAKVFVRLVAPEQWRKGMTKPELIRELRQSTSRIPGLQLTFTQPIRDSVEEGLSGVRGQVVLKVYGEDLTLMRQKLQEALQVLAPIEGIVDLSLYRDSVVPQLQIDLNRSALAREGILVDDVNEIIQTALAGKVVTEIWQGEQEIPIRVRLPLSERENPDVIGDLLVPTAHEGLVPLSELATLRTEYGRSFISREQNIRYLGLGFNVEGRDMGSVVDEAIETVNQQISLPDRHYFVWAGEFENQQRALQRLSIIVPLSLFIVFMLLYAALQSFRGATAIMLTAPFALTGGVFALALSGVHLSVSAAIGFIALLGQVSLMGLLIISGIDGERQCGLPFNTALINGSVTRIRAVLMAALLAAVGLLPMAFATGLGSETQQPFAMVIVGGMTTVFLVATLLLPALYSVLMQRKTP